MKKIFLLLFSGMTLLNADTLKHITLDNEEFTVTTETYDLYASKGEVMKLYKEEENNNLTFELSLILHDKTGSCADKSMQEGAYETNSTHLILYTFWDRRGNVYDTPYGAQIKTYRLQNGTLKPQSSQLYIETQKRGQSEEAGMKYLYSSPKNPEQKALLSAYITSVERQYKGIFVYGDEAKKLLERVRTALQNKVRNQWQ